MEHPAYLLTYFLQVSPESYDDVQYNLAHVFGPRLSSSGVQPQGLGARFRSVLLRTESLPRVLVKSPARTDRQQHCTKDLRNPRHFCPLLRFAAGPTFTSFVRVFLADPESAYWLSSISPSDVATTNSSYRNDLKELAIFHSHSHRRSLPTRVTGSSAFPLSSASAPLPSFPDSQLGLLLPSPEHSAACNFIVKNDACPSISHLLGVCRHFCPSHTSL
jgi:hypothetical protein